MLSLKRSMTKWLIDSLDSQTKDDAHKKMQAPPEQEVLDLRAEEWVEVHSPEEIKCTLGEDSAFDRTIFMHGMWKYCEKKFQVLKRIEKILDHRSSKMLKLKNTVILKGIYCEKDPTHFMDCDQTCFYYWKEAWLKRSDPPL